MSAKFGLLIEDDQNGLQRAINCAPDKDTINAYMDKNISWHWAKNYEQAIQYLEQFYLTFKKLPDLLAFDHDLGGNSYKLWHQHGGYQDRPINYDEYDEKTGYHVAKWITEYCLDNNITFNSKFYVHSLNSVGRQNIISLLNNFKKFQTKENA